MSSDAICLQCNMEMSKVFKSLVSRMLQAIRIQYTSHSEFCISLQLFQLLNFQSFSKTKSGKTLFCNFDVFLKSREMIANSKGADNEPNIIHLSKYTHTHTHTLVFLY